MDVSENLNCRGLYFRVFVMKTMNVWDRRRILSSFPAHTDTPAQTPLDASHSPIFGLIQSMMSRSDSIGDSLDAKPGSSSSSAVAVADQNQEPDDAHAPSLFEEADEATQIISYLIDALNNNKYGSVGYKKVELPGDSDDPGVWTRTGAEEEAKSARVRNIVGCLSYGILDV